MERRPMRTNDATEAPQDAAGEASAKKTIRSLYQKLPKALDMLRSLLVAHIGKRSKSVLAFNIIAAIHCSHRRDNCTASLKLIPRLPCKCENASGDILSIMADPSLPFRLYPEHQRRDSRMATHAQATGIETLESSCVSGGTTRST